MLDFSWSELMVVIVVAVIAIGPKQLPELLFGLGRIVRRLQYMRYALTRQFDDFMDESELRRFREDPVQMNQLPTSNPPPRVVDPSGFDEAEADEALVAQPPLKDEPEEEKKEQGSNV